MKTFLLSTTILALTLTTGCQSVGDFSLFGYTTRPPFSPDIRSVYIPTVKTTAFHTSPYRGIGVDLTQAIVDELARRRSPIRVVSDPARADTELITTITRIDKLVYNRNLLNQSREFDVIIGAEVVWRDLKTGRTLSGSREPNPIAQEMPFDPNRVAPPLPQPESIPTPVSISAQGRVLPELGSSNTTAAQTAVQRLAVQIVNMMEEPW